MAPFSITAGLNAADVAAGLSTARVLDPTRLRSTLAEFEQGHDPENGAAFADYLVQHGLLTPYQAQAVANGEAASLVVGPYLLLDPLSASGLGTPFRAVRLSDRTRFAVRLLPLRSLWKSREAKRQVARLTSLVSHAVLVPLTDVDTAGGHHYLAWPYAEGESLLRAVARQPLTPGAAVRLFAELADALSACHAAGVTHGLLRPSSILIGQDRHARLLDLGLGELLDDGDGESLFDTISTANSALERLDYTPPETIADPSVRSPAADAYSLGAILYFALTGVVPFPDGSVVDKMLAHQTGSPLPVRLRNPHVPTPIAGLVERMLAKDAESRPTTAQVRDELRAAEQGAELEPAPLSVTVSTLRDAAELTRTFELRKRSRPEEDAIGAVDFDLPPPHQSGESDLPSAPAKPAPAPLASRPSLKSEVPPLKPVPRLVRLPSVALPAPPVRPTRTPSGNVPKPSDLPIPVGFSSPCTEPASDSSYQLPDVVIPASPRRKSVGRLIQTLAFWRAKPDEVQFSIFGPPRIPPGQRVKFIVYAHLPEVSDNVITLCRAMHKDTELLGAGFADSPLPRGTELDLHLSVASAGVAKSTVKFAWTGHPQPKSFDVFVPWESPAGVSAGTLSSGTDGVQVAVVPLQFVILPRGRS